MDHLYKIKALYLGVEIVPESVHLITLCLPHAIVVHLALLHQQYPILLVLLGYFVGH